MEVGKEVFVAGIGGIAAGYVHFQFLAPQFAGQMIGPVKTSTLVDVIVAFLAGIVTTMYAKTALIKVLGYGLAGTLVAVGILDQFNMLGAPAAVRAFPMQVPLAPTGIVPRASYLAPPGIVVNKHGTIPEIAPGTFG